MKNKMTTSELKQYVIAEATRLYKIEVLKEEKARINKELKMLSEGDSGEDEDRYWKQMATSAERFSGDDEHEYDDRHNREYERHGLGDVAFAIELASAGKVYFDDMDEDDMDEGEFYMEFDTPSKTVGRASLKLNPNGDIVLYSVSGTGDNYRLINEIFNFGKAPVDWNPENRNVNDISDELRNLGEEIYQFLLANAEKFPDVD